MALAWGSAPGAPAWADDGSVAAGSVAVGVWQPSYQVQLRPGSAQGERVHRDALATSSRRGVALLHVVTVADDSARDGGVASYGRSLTTGATWGQRVRISPVSHVATDAVDASAGRWVYAAWVRSNTTGRGSTLYVRVNHAYGAAGAWSAARRLGPVDAGCCTAGVSIAATGTAAFITGSADGHAIVWVGRDHGSRWLSRRLGTTDADSYGATAVAARGPVVAAAWTHASADVRVRISRDGGRHWALARRLAAGQVTSAAVLGDRIAVAGSTDGDRGPMRSWVRTWSHGTWARTRIVRDTSAVWGDVDVQLRGRSALGVAYADALTPAWVGGYRYGVVWRTSTDGGRTWTPATEVESTPTLTPGEIPSRRFSALWTAAGDVHVLSSLTTISPEYVSTTVLRSRT